MLYFSIHQVIRPPSLHSPLYAYILNIGRMKTLTLKSARKVLGKAAQGVSDDQLQKEIEAATLLKDFFFDTYLKERKKTMKLTP